MAILWTPEIQQRPQSDFLQETMGQSLGNFPCCLCNLRFRRVWIETGRKRKNFISSYEGKSLGKGFMTSQSQLEWKAIYLRHRPLDRLLPQTFPCFYRTNWLINCWKFQSYIIMNNRSKFYHWVSWVLRTFELIGDARRHCGLKLLFTASIPIVVTRDGIQFSLVTQSCLTLCDPMDCSTPGFPVHHQLLELAQTHIYWIGDAIQTSHPLSSPSPPALSLSQHHGLFQRVSSLHQVARVLELQFQHQSFQWIFWTDFL